MFIAMSSIPLIQNKIVSLALGNGYKFFHTNLCVSRKYLSDMSFQHRTFYDLCVKRSHVWSVISIRHMAGHSKWQNVKHVKDMKDRQKNVICNKFSYLVRLAVKEGGKDPNVNLKLASLLEQAKKQNVPSSTIQNALKRDSKRDKFGSIELLGPGGCIILLEFETDNVSSIRHEVKTACKKHGANVMSGEGRWRAVYEQKGIIKAVGRKNSEPLDAEKALDDAIIAGAEEVLTKENEDNKIFFEFLCSPNDLHMVKKEIEKNYEVEEGYIGYLPITFVELNKTDMTSLDNLLEDLGSLQDVVRIYENVQ